MAIPTTRSIPNTSKTRKVARESLVLNCWALNSIIIRKVYFLLWHNLASPMTATDGLRAYIRGFAKLPLTVSNAALQCLETPFNRDCISNNSVFLHHHHVTFCMVSLLLQIIGSPTADFGCFCASSQLPTYRLQPHFIDVC